jgi:hypothetical protein
MCLDGGWVCEVSQCAYGHKAAKLTWLYYKGDTPPPGMDWSRPEPELTVSNCTKRGDGSFYRDSTKRMRSGESSATPIPFRDLLINIAESANK